MTGFTRVPYSFAAAWREIPALRTRCREHELPVCWIPLWSVMSAPAQEGAGVTGMEELLLCRLYPGSPAAARWAPSWW